MANTLIRVYSSMSNAQHARLQLLDAEFPESRVHLVSTKDEAGPVQGNFTVGNLHPDDDVIYQHDYGHVAQRGTCLLTVEAEDEEQARRADEIMRRFGAMDVERRTAQPDNRH